MYNIKMINRPTIKQLKLFTLLKLKITKLGQVTQIILEFTIFLIGNFDMPFTEIIQILQNL